MPAPAFDPPVRHHANPDGVAILETEGLLLAERALQYVISRRLLGALTGLAGTGKTFVDWAQVIKEYQSTNIAPGRYSPPACTGVRVKPQLGNHDLSKTSTSYIERQNLTMRMNMRRYTRLTNAFSKRLESHAVAVALHFMAYNFARPHKTLAKPYPRTPAMAADVSDRVWTMQEIAALLN